ncbi:hypothetical protein AVEN_46516-1 [Araneus ventricosus]|uniref:Photolyase/cryptochrome alpha/beta domain-containing protein n=1 Tax=Araneus ventricosus TaxID=182803 RepID=A0A4Y2HBN7_ARAVE|nr:hypothetical protein AVEN_46516-1 [Araneus ventricosus]
MAKNLEQHYCIKFCVKYGDSQEETIREIEQASGDDAIRTTKIKKWYNRFEDDNEIADALAKAGADDASVPSAPLTYLELFSRDKSRNKTIWLIPPVHHWYQGSRTGGCLSIDCNRRDQLLLASLVGISEV